jgi:asparagine synthase (glutamine-hydrolysing)
MSGIYFIQKPDNRDLREIANLTSCQLSYGREIIDHFAIEENSVFGMVSPDKLEKGLMPRFYSDDRLWGIFLGSFNGVDHNDFYKDRPEIKDDLDLIKRLYLDDKLKDTLPELNGAFFFILYDLRERKLIAGNDRYGMYPMYWSQSEDGFCLSSRVLASVLSNVVPGKWNMTGVMQLLTVDDLLSDSTLVEGVRAFPQASMLIKTDSELKWHTYWHYNYSALDESINRFELARYLGNQFAESVRILTGSNKRIGVTLSGGLDSRIIVAAASKAGIPLHTFTWGKFDSYDRRFARDVSRVYGTIHHDSDYFFSNLETRYEAGIRATEGHINYFDCHMLAHLEIMGDHADVILNGYAGDLVLGGSYLRPTWMRDMSTDDLAEILFHWRNTNIPESRLGHAVTCYDEISEDQKTSYLYRELIKKKKGMRSPDIVESFFLENRVRRQCSMGTVLMRYVTESVAPFFEYRMLDLTTSIPATLRYEHKIYLLMMKEIFPEALPVRWQRTLLPASAPGWTNLPMKAFLKGCRLLENRLGWSGIASKQSPIDFDLWLRGPMRKWMENVVYDGNPRADEVLRPEFCVEVWKRHLDGENLSRLLGAIISVRGFADALAKACSKVVPFSISPKEITME